MLPKNRRQELLSLAYVRAVVARAGCVCTVPDSDFGVDVYIRQVQAVGSEFHDTGESPVDVQLRSTTQATVTDSEIVYDLDARTYRLLRHPDPVPVRVLVLLVLPDDETEWFAQTEEQLMVRHCAYWLSLRGAPTSTASRSVRVRIPRSQVFTPDALTALFRPSEGSESNDAVQ